MKNKSLLFFLLTTGLVLFFISNTQLEENINTDEQTTKATYNNEVIVENTNRLPANIPKIKENLIEKAQLQNEAEEAEKKQDLSKETEIFKELTDLNSDQFIEDIKAIEVFDKELAAELREDLNLKPSDLDEMQREYTEQIEVDYDSFDIEL